MSYISDLVSAVPATMTFEAYPTITGALQSIDSEGINTEVESQNDLATSALQSALIASTTASGASLAYPSHVSCQLAFPPESTPDSIGLATFAITPYNPNDQGTQYFGFGLNPEYGSQAITSESRITDDELLFYRVESSILPWDGYCDAGLGYYYHGVTGLCVTVAQTAHNYPKFQKGRYYLDFCDICNDGTPPLSQLFCLNSADCLTFSGDVPLAREKFYGLNGYENLVGAAVLNAGDCIMYTDGNLEIGNS
jgi:hypothetical protein